MYHNNQLIPFCSDSICSELQEAFECIDKIESLNLDGQKGMAVRTFLKKEGASEGAIAIVQSIVVQEMSSKMDNCSVYEVCRLSNAWHVGNDSYRIGGSFNVLIDYYLKQIGDGALKLNWQATKIEYRSSTKGRVVVSNQHGERLEASYVIISVPLTVLRDGDIDFDPPLPHLKLMATKNLSFEVAYRIICRFQKVFWPTEFGIICCSNGFASQIHQDCRYEKFAGCVNEFGLDRTVEKTLNRDDLHSDGCFMLSGFQTAELAEAKERLSDEEMTKGFLDQLDEIFGVKPCVNGSKTPASDNFMGSIVKRWSTEPFIRGSYSGPSILSTESDYYHLAKPVDDCLFFAGEGTSSDIPSTVEAAVITGERAAMSVLTKLQKEENSPSYITVGAFCY